MASPEITNDGTVSFESHKAVQHNGLLFVPARYYFRGDALEQCDVLRKCEKMPAGKKELDLRSWLGRVGVEAHVIPESLKPQKGRDGSRDIVGEGTLQFLLKNEQDEYPVFNAMRTQLSRGRVKIGRLLYFPEDCVPMDIDQIQEAIGRRMLLGNGHELLPDKQGVATVRLPLHPNTQFYNGVRHMHSSDWARCFDDGRPALERFQPARDEADPLLSRFDLRAIQISLGERLFAWLDRNVHVQGLGNNNVQHVAARYIGDQSVGMKYQHLRHVEMLTDENVRVRAEDARIDTKIYDQTPSSSVSVPSAGIPQEWIAKHLQEGSVLDQALIEMPRSKHDVQMILRYLNAPESRHHGVLTSAKAVHWVERQRDSAGYVFDLRDAVFQYGQGQRNQDIPESLQRAAEAVGNFSRFEGHAYHRMSLFCHTLPPVRELSEMVEKGVRSVFCTNLSGVPSAKAPDVDLCIPYDQLKQYANLSEKKQVGIYWVPVDREMRIRKLRGHLFVDVQKLKDFDDLRYVLGIYCSSAGGMEDAVQEDVVRAYEKLQKEHGSFAIATGASGGLMQVAMKNAPLSIGISTIIPGQYPNMNADGLLVLPQDELGDRQTALSEHIHDAIVWNGGPGTAYEAALEGVFRKVSLVPFAPVPCVDFRCKGDPNDPTSEHQWRPLVDLAEAYTTPFEIGGRQIRFCDDSGRHVHKLVNSLDAAVDLLAQYNEDPAAHWNSLGLSEKQIRTALLFGRKNAKEVQIRMPAHMRPAYERYMPEVLLGGDTSWICPE